MQTTKNAYWDKAKFALTFAKAITWDECHKIYVLMDEKQIKEMIGYGYDPIRVTDKDEALATLKEWYWKSCPLAFISAIGTVKGNPNEGFADIIPQGADWDE